MIGNLAPPESLTAAFSATEPVLVLVLKNCFYPAAATASLCLVLMAAGESLRGVNLLLAALNFLAVLAVFDARETLRTAKPAQALLRILQRWLIVVFGVGLLLHFADLSNAYSAMLLLQWVVATPVLMWLAHLIGRRAVRGLRSHEPTMRALIIGVTEVGRVLEARLRAGPLAAEVIGFIEDRAEDRSLERDPDRPAVKILGTTRELPILIPCFDIHAVFITLPLARDERSRALLARLRDCSTSVYYVPDLLVANSVQARFDVVGGLPVVAVRQSPLFGAGGAVKRAIDILVSAALIVVLAPVLLGTALGVRLTSPGPVIFKQRRYGLYGREITIYKFRSMKVTEDGDTQYRQVTRHDARVSAFGAFIRRTSIDELPQLFNVLEGSLSLVGPRPHVVAVNETYRHLIPDYMVRHNVKPGITGWAQINGYRGGDDLESMRGRVKCDLEYLRNWSVMLDLMIILRTAAKVWKDGTAY